MPSIFARQDNPVESVTVATGGLTGGSSSSFSESASAILGHVVCRALTDRTYETKKKGAKEIEVVVRFVQEREIGVAREKTSAIIDVLVSEFLGSRNLDFRVGGFVGLVGVAQGLEKNTKYYLAKMIFPVIEQFKNSSELSVRYYAAECLYNLCLIAPADVVVVLNELVEILFEMWRDPHANLRRAAQYMDLPLLEVVTMKYATESQVLSLGRQVVAELSSQKQSLYVIPWVEYVLVCCTKYELEFPLGVVVTSLVSTGQASVEGAIRSAVDVLISGNVKQPKDWDVNFGASLNTLIKDGDAMVQKMVLVCLSSMLKGGEEFLLKFSSILVESTMTMVAYLADSSDLAQLQGMSSELEAMVEEINPGEENLSSIASTASEIISETDAKANLTAIEMGLKWIKIVAARATVVPSSECFDSIVEITTHECARVRTLATDCIVYLCRVSKESRDKLILSSVEGVCKSRSLDHGKALIDLIQCLLKNMDESEILALKEKFPEDNMLENQIYYHIFVLTDLLANEAIIKQPQKFLESFGLLNEVISNMGPRGEIHTRVAMHRRGFPVADLTMLVAYSELRGGSNTFSYKGQKKFRFTYGLPEILHSLPRSSPVFEIVAAKAHRKNASIDKEPIVEPIVCMELNGKWTVPTVEQDIKYRKIIGEILLPLAMIGIEERFGLSAPRIRAPMWTQTEEPTISCQESPAVEIQQNLRYSTDMSPVDATKNSSPATTEESCTSTPEIEVVQFKVQDRSVDVEKEEIC